MTIKVTLEFASVDETIVALGKLVGAGERQGRSTPPIPATQNVAVPAPTTKRKPGRPRKVDDPVATVSESAPAVATVEARPVAAIALEPVEQPTVGADLIQGDATAPSAASPTRAEALAALEKLFNAQGMGNAQSVLADFGAARIGDLKPERYAEFIVAVNAKLTATK